MHAAIVETHSSLDCFNNGIVVPIGCLHFIQCSHTMQWRSGRMRCVHVSMCHVVNIMILNIGRWMVVCSVFIDVFVRPDATTCTALLCVAARVKNKAKHQPKMRFDKARSTEHVKRKGKRENNELNYSILNGWSVTLHRLELPSAQASLHR